MDITLVEYLVGLYFIGVGLPTLLNRPVTIRGSIQLIYGIILVVMAFTRVGLLR